MTDAIPDAEFDAPDPTIVPVPTHGPVLDQKVVVPAPTPDVPENVGVPTQVANPKRASWRTFLQAIIAAGLGANGFLVGLQLFLQANSETASATLGKWYPTIIVWLNVAVVVTAFIAKFIAWLMAQPGVNAWIAKNLPALAPIKSIGQHVGGE